MLSKTSFTSLAVVNSWTGVISNLWFDIWAYAAPVSNLKTEIFEMNAVFMKIYLFSYSHAIMFEPCRIFQGFNTSFQFY